jgi:hypothetical protein
MTYGLTNKQAVLTLSDDETVYFQYGAPVTEKKFSRKGIFEITVQKKLVCPSVRTQAFLRNLIHAHQSSLGQGDAACTLTVDDVLNGEKISPKHRLRKDQIAFKTDLEVFQEFIGGEVLIVEIA